KVPSLRDRLEDVPLLANHFLKVFAKQYQKPPLHFSPEAEAAILRHSWTGNVRELRNRVLQAVVLAENAWIGPELIELDASRNAAVASPKRAPMQAPSAREIWDGLRASLRAQLESLLEGPEVAIRPLGRWMTQDLVREA